MTDTDAQWKQRYYDSLEELERQERKWAQIENLLRTGVSRLTLLAEPEHEALNRQLEELRNAIRRGRDSLELQGQLDRISDAIVELDKRRAAARRNALPANEVLLRLLDALTLPRGLGRRAKSLRKSLVKADPKDDPGALISEFSQLLDETLAFLTAPPEEDGDSKRSGLFGNLFAARSRDDENDPESPTAAAAAQRPQSVAPSALLLRFIEQLSLPEYEDFDEAGFAARARVAVRPEQLSALVDDLAKGISALFGLPTPKDLPSGSHNAAIGEALIQLLERLALPESFDEKVNLLKDELASDPDEEVVRQGIVKLANLIADMRVRMESEKRELETFLKQLTLNLEEIDVHLQDSSARQEASLRDGRQLDDAVQAEVRGIEDSVNSARELDALKSQIEGRLNTIREHMTVFRASEEGRYEEAVAQVERLQGQLRQMESEAEELRDTIKQARSEALSDVLTGLPNRLAYEERATQEFLRWQRYANPLSLIVLDVDFFKRINDSYGHSAGDKVLKVIGDVLARNVRATDFIARYGGEEFTILTPETDAMSAQQAAEKLRQAVAQCEFHYRGERVQITVSCGVAQCMEGDSLESLFERADQALYRAKSQGRNRSCIAEAA